MIVTRLVRQAAAAVAATVRAEARLLADCRQAIEDERVRRELDELRRAMGGRPNAALDRDLARAARLRHRRRGW